MANNKTPLQIMFQAILWGVIISVPALLILSSISYTVSVSDWNIGSNWHVGSNWVVGTTSVSTPFIAGGGIAEIIKQFLHFFRTG